MNMNFDYFIQAYFNAVKKGQVEVVQDLLEQYPILLNHIDEKGYSALNWAIVYNNTVLATLLLEKGINLVNTIKIGNFSYNITEFAQFYDRSEILKLINTGRSLTSNQTPQSSIIFKEEDIAEDVFKESIKEFDEQQYEIQANKDLFFKYVAEGNREEINKLLEQKPGLLKLKDIQGLTALHIAIIKNDFDLLKFLLDKDHPVDLREDEFEATPLHFAVYFGRFDMVNLLIAYKANIMLEDKNKKTPLQVANERKESSDETIPIEEYDKIAMLLQQPEQKSEFIPQEDDIPIDILLASMEQFEEQQNEIRANKDLFFKYVAEGNREEINKLLEQTPGLIKSKDTEGLTALHIAIKQNNIDLLNLLLDKGHPVDLREDKLEATPLHFAVYFGSFDIVNILIANRADITLENVDKKTPLQIANERKFSSDRTIPIEEYNKIAMLLQQSQYQIDPVLPFTSESLGENPRRESESKADVYEGEFIRNKTPKDIADLSATDVGRCLYRAMKNIKQTYNFTATTEGILSVRNVSDWFKFNGKSNLTNAEVTLKGDSKTRKVFIDGSLVKSTIDFDENGQSKFISGIVEGYPSINDKLLKMSKRKPQHLPLQANDRDFIYPEQPGKVYYDRLLASDLLSIARGQKPKYYTHDRDIQFLTEVGVLLFGVENMSTRDYTNTQLGANLLLLDMISKKQKYGKDLHHYFRIHNFLDSAKLIAGERYYKKTATYPRYIQPSNNEIQDSTNLTHDLELTALQKTSQNHENRRRFVNNYASPSTYTLITEEEHNKNLKSNDKMKKKADTLGGMSPSTTGTYTGVSEGIYGEKSKFLNKESLKYTNVLKDDSNLIDHRILLKENKILYYWLRQNAPDCFKYTPEKTTEAKVEEALTNGIKDIIKNTKVSTPLFQMILSGRPINIHQLNNINLNIRNFEGHTALHIAIKIEHLQATDTLQKIYKQKNLTFAVYDAYGDTPLHLAAKVGNIEVMQLLLFGDKSVEEQLQLLQLRNLFNENTLLHSSIIANNKQMIEALIDLYAQQAEHVDLFNAKNKDGDTPLHLAIKNNNKDAIEKILATEKVDLTIQNNNGVTPLHLAVANNNSTLAERLLNTKEGYATLNSISKSGKAPLHLAIIKDNSQMIDLLIKFNAFLNISQFKQPVTSSANLIQAPLHTAIARRNLNAINQLLNKDATIENSKDNNLLHYLAATKSMKDKQEINDHHPSIIIIKACLNDINIPNKTGNSALHIAIQRGNYDVALALIYCGADVNFIAKNKMHTPLHNVQYQFNAIKSKRTETENKLNDLREKIKVDTDNKVLMHDLTICEETIQYYKNNEKVLENLILILLSNGARIDLKDKSGLTPLHLALMSSSSQIIKNYLSQLFMLKKSEIGSLIHMYNSDRNTALHFAVMNRSGNAAVKALIDMGANRFSINSNGDTPLHIICINKNLSVITPFLLNIDREDAAKLINMTNKKGETPFCLAIQSQNKILISLLKEHGADVNSKYNNVETLLHFAMRTKNKLLASELIKYGADINVLNSRECSLECVKSK